MKSRKLTLNDTMKQLSEKEKKEALKWIDNLSKKELKELEQLNTIQLVELVIEKYFKSKARDSKKHPKN